MKKGILFFLALCLSLATGLSADILLDELPLEKGQLLLFKDHASPNSFYYISTGIRIASGPDNKPKVSFFKLKDQEGALSFFLTCGLTPEKLAKVRMDLAEESPEILLKGPVAFLKGKYFVFNRINGKSELWAEGKAPLFPNQEVVITKRLKGPLEPDIVAVFVMEYEGITQKINARLSVNWDEVYIQREMVEKTNWTIVEIKQSLYKLRESGAIRLEVTGDYGNFTQVWDIALSHLIHQMFEVQEIKMNGSAGLGVEFGADSQNIIYAFRKEKKSGSYQVDFNRRFRDKRQVVLVSEIGDAIKKAIDQ
jgi:hypothetical protein